MKSIVKSKITTYPKEVQDYLIRIRSIIYDVARELHISEVTETLKWGEPSYLTPNGSTLRVDWKKENPDFVSLFFNCKTIIVETIKEIFGNHFIYNGTREIQLSINEPLPVEELKVCISFALEYHSRKKVPLLGY